MHFEVHCNNGIVGLLHREFWFSPLTFQFVVTFCTYVLLSKKN